MEGDELEEVKTPPATHPSIKPGYTALGIPSKKKSLPKVKLKKSSSEVKTIKNTILELG